MFPTPPPPPPCPLCRAGGGVLFHQAARGEQVRTFLRCPRCGLVHVPPEQRLDAAAERARYDLHENDSGDDGYRRFLSRLATPLLARLAPGSKGLDFGCGPSPVLADMLRSAGHDVAVYDPFYAADPAPLADTYDFITATEVVEHLHDPGAVLRQLWSCVRPGGVLALMTQLLPAPDDFSTWHYISDPTHVCFFGDRSFAWLGEELGTQPELHRGGVVFLDAS